jgi:hypothetical protein
MHPISNALSSGTALLQQAQTRIDQHARQLAQVAGHSPSQPADITVTDSLIGLQQAETCALSGLKVIQAADNVIGTLLDIQA